MFIKGTMKDKGIDVTLRNNPDHVLAPDDINVIRDFKFDKISDEDFKVYYQSLLRTRWENRRPEFFDLVKKGKEKDIKLKCTCSQSCTACHANLAAKFLNGLISKV